MTGQLHALDEAMDGILTHAAESLESAADSVRSGGDQGAAAISGLANGAGEKLDSTASYVRAVHPENLVTGLRRAVRRHPVGSLALAAAVGLIAGFSYRRSGSEC